MNIQTVKIYVCGESPPVMLLLPISYCGFLSVMQ